MPKDQKTPELPVTAVAEFYAQYYEDDKIYQLDGWDDAIVGIVEIDDPALQEEEGDDATGHRFVYDRDIIWEKLRDDIIAPGVDRYEAGDMAEEYFQFNIMGVLPSMGARRPLMIERPHLRNLQNKSQ